MHEVLHSFPGYFKALLLELLDQPMSRKDLQEALRQLGVRMEPITNVIWTSSYPIFFPNSQMIFPIRSFPAADIATFMIFLLVGPVEPIPELGTGRSPSLTF